MAMVVGVVDIAGRRSMPLTFQVSPVVSRLKADAPLMGGALLIDRTLLVPIMPCPYVAG